MRDNFRSDFFEQIGRSGWSDRMVWFDRISARSEGSDPYEKKGSVMVETFRNHV